MENELERKITIKDMFEMKIKLYADIQKTKEVLKDIKSLADRIDSGLAHEIFNHDFSMYYHDEYIQSGKYIERSLWRLYVGQTALTDLMTCKQKEKFDKEIAESTVPFTIETAIALQDDVQLKAKDAIVNTIQEVFKDFTGTDYGINWKQEKKDNMDKIYNNFRCSKSVYLDKMFNRFNISSYRLGAFNDLEVACSILDGKRKPRYPDTIDDKIKKGKGEDTFICEYFEVKCYKNGNQKIRFLREDILEKLNYYGSNRSGIGTGQKKYKT